MITLSDAERDVAKEQKMASLKNWLLMIGIFVLGFVVGWFGEIIRAQFK